MDLTRTGTQKSNALAAQTSHAAAIKTILVPISGSETDRVVLCAAWAIARSLRVHLECLHLRLKLHEAAAGSSRVGFCAGTTAPDALDNLAREQANLSTSAANYVTQFCREHGIAFSIRPSAAGLSADCLEEDGSPIATLLFHARHSDLTVLGRPQHDDCLPKTFIEEVLVESGRPLLIVPPGLGRPLLETIVVGWKESAASARAIAAALPLLQVAERVVVVNIAEDNSPGLKALEGVRQYLAFHGITAEVRRLGEGVVTAERLLSEAVEEMEAGLLVIGGFGHSRMRETVFGGVTRTLLKKAEFPVFIVH